MNEKSPSCLPKSFADAIALAAESKDLSKPDRMKLHRLCLQAIGFWEGLDGVKRYKAEFPECMAIQVNLNSLAYIPKPKGYNAYLARQAEAWLSNSAARSTSNADDVRALNDRLGTKYNPNKHFSEPLSSGRRKAIKAVFNRAGVPFDLKSVKTMSGVKAAARAARAQIDGERRLGTAGVISGNTLVIGGRPFTVCRNGQRECIRVMIGSVRRRLYLDEIEWLVELLEICGNDPLSTTTVRSCGNVAYEDISADIPGQPDEEISGLANDETCEIDPLEFL